MLTESSREEEGLSSFELGADDLVTKPFTPSELLARIRALLHAYFRYLVKRAFAALADIDLSAVDFAGVSLILPRANTG
jgi:DNA-binding response OmpR family regulator